MFKSLIALGLTLPVIGFSQQFQQSFGGDGFDIIKEVIQLEDQSYVSFGNTSSFGDSPLASICHLDGLGNLVSSYTMQLNNGTEIHDVEVNNDGNVYFVGANVVDASGDVDCLYGELSLEGNILWAKTIPGIGIDTGCSIELNEYGGFTFVILTNSFSSTGNYNPALVEVNSEGSAIWSTNIDINGYARPTDLAAHPDGGWLIFGHLNNDESLGYDPMLIKISQSGEVEWVKNFEGDEVDFGWRILATESGFIIGGDTNSFGEGLNEIYLIHIDFDGNIINQRTYGGTGNDHLSSMIPGKGDKLIIGGTTGSFGGGGLDILSMEIESDGSVSWSKAYGGGEKDIGFSVLKTPDGGYLFGGYSRSFAENFYYNAYLVKTNERGDCYCNSTWDHTLLINSSLFTVGDISWSQNSLIEAELVALQVEESPFSTAQTLCSYGDLIDGMLEGEENSDDVTLSIDNPIGEIVDQITSSLDGSLQIEVIQHQPANLSVYTLTGRMVQNVPISGDGRQTVSVKVKGMSQGIYLISLVDSNSSHTKKVFIN